MKLLIVASASMEFPGILARAQEIRPVSLGLHWSRSATFAGHQVLLVANGAGSQRAARAVDASLPSFAPDAILSTGFCGALAPQLGVADVVVADSIAAGGRTYSAHPAVSSLPHYTGAVCCIGHVARTADEKHSLYSTGAIAVEMEAGGVAGRAEALGLPFYCIRAVTDLAGETMANDFNAALRTDGHFDTMIILRASLLKPLVRIPELFRLRNRCRRAARVLGEFIADCRL
jgi:adenosylhomocysteine nucleosidase